MFKSLAKTIARLGLHHLGGLAVARNIHRREFGVLMFHSFSEAERDNMEALCEHIARHYHPVSLSEVAAAIHEGVPLPDHALAITIDDGYRNFLDHGHPIFHKQHIPTTIYAVANFSDGRLWLWPDQVQYALEQTAKEVLEFDWTGSTLRLPLTTKAERGKAIAHLHEALKLVPNEQRLRFCAELGSHCAVDMPTTPPPGRAALNWDELRALASEQVEIGCHTATHPILSRVSDPAALAYEIGGAKQLMEERLGFPIRHFCYPNGRPIDIGDAALECVRQAGYATAVTCTFGLNTPQQVDPIRIRRTPSDSTMPYAYAVELMAGLHL